MTYSSFWGNPLRLSKTGLFIISHNYQPSESFFLFIFFLSSPHPSFFFSTLLPQSSSLPSLSGFFFCSLSIYFLLTSPSVSTSCSHVFHLCLLVYVTQFLSFCLHMHTHTAMHFLPFHDSAYMTPITKLANCVCVCV